MKQSEMITIANIVAAKLMDTFASRLDMIEESVFCGIREKNAESLNLSVYQELRAAILKANIDRPAMTHMDIYQLPDIAQALGVRDGAAHDMDVSDTIDKCLIRMEAEKEISCYYGLASLSPSRPSRGIF